MSNQFALNALSQNRPALLMYGPWGSGFIGNVTGKLENTWRRSIRSVGGYWIATANWDGPLWEMEEVFMEGITREIRESLGGLVTWEGFLAEMVLTKNGYQYKRSW